MLDIGHGKHQSKITPLIVFYQVCLSTAQSNRNRVAAWADIHRKLCGKLDLVTGIEIQTGLVRVVGICSKHRLPKPVADHISVNQPLDGIFDEYACSQRDQLSD